MYALSGFHKHALVGRTGRRLGGKPQRAIPSSGQGFCGPKLMSSRHPFCWLRSHTWHARSHGPPKSSARGGLTPGSCSKTPSMPYNHRSTGNSSCRTLSGPSCDRSRRQDPPSSHVRFGRTDRTTGRRFRRWRRCGAGGGHPLGRRGFPRQHHDPGAGRTRRVRRRAAGGVVLCFKLPRQMSKRVLLCSGFDSSLIHSLITHYRLRCHDVLAQAQSAKVGKSANYATVHASSVPRVCPMLHATAMRRR